MGPFLPMHYDILQTGKDDSMKKIVIFLLAGCLAAALLAGCGGGEPAQTTEEPAVSVTNVVQQDVYSEIFDETYTLSIPEDWK